MMLGPVVPTVKFTPLLATPPTVTTTFPVVAPPGTATVMLVAVQLDGDPGVPLNVTVLAPWLAPKLLPLMVMVKGTLLTGTVSGVNVLIAGGENIATFSGSCGVIPGVPHATVSRLTTRRRPKCRIVASGEVRHNALTGGQRQQTGPPEGCCQDERVCTAAGFCRLALVNRLLDAAS